MPTRLSTVAPDIESALLNASTTVCVIAALEVARWAANEVGLFSENYSKAISEGNTAEVESLSAALDEQYFSQPEESPDRLVFFSRARAASAIAFALAQKPTDAIYEAIIATNDPTSIRRVLSEVM